MKDFGWKVPKQPVVITRHWHRRWHVSLPSGVCLCPAFPNTNNSELFPLFLPQLSLFQLAAATSRYPTISHSTSALPWQQSFPSQLHPSSLALAHQLSHVVRYPPPYPHRHTHADLHPCENLCWHNNVLAPTTQGKRPFNELWPAKIKSTAKEKKKPTRISGLVSCSFMHKVEHSKKRKTLHILTRGCGSQSNTIEIDSPCTATVCCPLPCSYGDTQTQKHLLTKHHLCTVVFFFFFLLCQAGDWPNTIRSLHSQVILQRLL